MSEFWNSKNLTPPPVHTIKCNSDTINARELHTICKELQDSLKDDDLFQTEAALLSRYIYKIKNKFSTDKGFRNLRKVKQCLLRYQGLKYLQVLKNFLQCLPERATGTILYLPSRQMLQYVLVRLLGLAKLLHQTGDFCESAALGKGQRVQLGHSWSLATVMLAMSARIWTLCRRWVWTICQSYRNILKFVPQLPSSDAPWLPSTFTFPPDLAIWLGAHRPSSNTSNITPENIPHFNKIFELLEDEEDDTVVIESSEQLNDNLSNFKSEQDEERKSNRHSAINSEDLGESVPLTNEIDDLQTLDDITKFISKSFEGKNLKNIKVILKKSLNKLGKASKSGKNQQAADIMRNIKHALRKKFS